MSRSLSTINIKKRLQEKYVQKFYKKHEENIMLASTMSFNTMNNMGKNGKYRIKKPGNGQYHFRIKDKDNMEIFDMYITLDELYSIIKNTIQNLKFKISNNELFIQLVVEASISSICEHSIIDKRIKEDITIISQYAEVELISRCITNPKKYLKKPKSMINIYIVDVKGKKLYFTIEEIDDISKTCIDNIDEIIDEINDEINDEIKIKMFEELSAHIICMLYDPKFNEQLIM